VAQQTDRLLICSFILCFYLLCNSCVQQAGKQQPVAPPPVPPKNLSVKGFFSAQQQRLLHTDSIHLKTFFLQYPQLNAYAADVTRFYNYRNNRYAWYDENGLVEQASNLYNHLTNLASEGIETPLPCKLILDSLLNDPLASNAPDRDLEIMLSAEYFFYAETVWAGISEQKTNKLEWFLPRKKLNLPYMMDSLIKDSSASLFSAQYNIQQYNLLKTALQKYRHLDSMGDWKPLPAGSTVFKKKDSTETIGMIRHRLYLLGDLDQNSQDKKYDEQLEIAVKAFQARYGMTPDGVMGEGFFREINTPLKDNIRKLIVNMERTRWLPMDLASHFIVINIPFFTLTVYDQDTISFNMNVVVGKDLHQTVIFNGDIKYIVFSPYWNVPVSIMKKEILPAIAKNPGYLKRNNMEWNGNTIRQKPGPKNSLGLVKFLFPNSYNIYLHDSPAKSLFSSPTRAFSHGCIRLAEPKKLAVYLLKQDPSWNEDKIQAAMTAGKEKYVTLKKPVPVLIGYMTAWVDKNGKLNFRKDIYNRDQRLEDLLLHP